MICLIDQALNDVPDNHFWLHPNEAARLATMRFPKRRADFLLGRWTAKQALISFLRTTASLDAIEIRAAADGAPEAWIHGEPAEAIVSISHREGRALCAAAPLDIVLGCDLEFIEAHSDAFVLDYFTQAEQRMARDAPDKQALLWSAKESALKALREGLRLDPRRLSVQLPAPSALVVRCHDGRLLHGWWEIEDRWVRTLISDPLTACKWSGRRAASDRNQSTSGA